MDHNPDPIDDATKAKFQRMANRQTGIVMVGVIFGMSIGQSVSEAMAGESFLVARFGGRTVNRRGRRNLCIFNGKNLAPVNLECPLMANVVYGREPLRLSSSCVVVPLRPPEI